MKKAGCAALGCLGVLALAAAFAGLLALDALERASVPPPPSPVPPVPGAPSPEPPTPATDPDAYVRGIGSLAEASRTEFEGRHRLTYGFIDHHGRRQRVTCSIGKAEHEQERAGFGYVDGEPEKAALRRLKQMVDARIAEDGIAAYFRFDVDLETRETKWEWKVGGEVPQPEQSEAIARCKRLAAWIERDGDPILNRLEAGLYKERGFVLRGRRLRIDYEGVVDRARGPLTDCAVALQRAGGGSSERQYLGLFTAFLQELPYQVPPDYEGKRFINGFWVPTEVLVHGHGDCDSKSAAFCALWRQRFSSRLLFLLLPRHALVGVESTPRPGEHFVRVGNRYFVLCEVAGGAKIHPGRDPISGTYEYVLLEPLTAG